MTDIAEEIAPDFSFILTPHVARDALYSRYRERIRPNTVLSRALVSFQANKTEPMFNWFKYKEGFSQTLVSYLINGLVPTPGILLDPFAGAGSSLFTGRHLGWQVQGIELLPVGAFVTETRRIAEEIDCIAFQTAVADILRCADFAPYFAAEYALQHIPITAGAFPPDEEKQLVGYLAYCHDKVQQTDIRQLLFFAAIFLSLPAC